ncbi:MAG: o-succinylbenzoate synthase [Bacteroidota bacterium]
MRIEKISLREIRLPLKEPFRISSGVTDTRRICLLELVSSDGITEWSECVAGEEPNYSSETIDTAWMAIREWVAPRILGKELKAPQEVRQLLKVDFRGHNMAKAAVEMGIWAVSARTAGVSLSKLLGGVRDEIEVGISIGIQESPQALAEKVKWSLERGYQKVKMKIKPERDVDFVRYVREAVGRRAPLMVDANNAYGEADFETLQKLDEFRLLMIEQPLAWDDLVKHAKLQKLLKTPLCLDESITSVERAQDMIELGSGKIVNIKPGRVGGFSSSAAIHDLCAQYNIPVWCGGMLESGVGRAHNVALATLPNFLFPGDISPSERYWEKDIVIPEWTMSSDGRIKVPVEKPGIGVEVDRDRIETLTVRSEALTQR